MATTWLHGGYCACGCGGKTNLAPYDNRKLGVFQSEPYEYIQNHQNEKKRKTYIVEDRGFETPCHVWQGQPSQRYPSLKIKGKSVKVHQHAWEGVHGPVPRGLVLHHRCEVTRCRNVEHLELETGAGNAQQGSHVRLSMEKAEQIRRLWASSSYTRPKLAEMYGVSVGTIENVIYGYSWRAVELHRPQRPERRQDN